MVMKEVNIIRCLFLEVERLILIVVGSEFVDFNEMVPYLYFVPGPACPQIYTEAAQVSLERPSGAVHRVETVRHLKLLMRERGNVLGGNPHSAWKGWTSQLFADIAGWLRRNS
jgi:hypothetical protein